MEQWELSRIETELEQFNFTDEPQVGETLDAKLPQHVDDDKRGAAESTNLPAAIGQRNEDTLTSCCHCQRSLTLQTYTQCTLTPNCRCQCHSDVTSTPAALTVAVASDREPCKDSCLRKHQSLLATNFLTAKYDSLGRVAVVKPRLSDQLSLYAVSRDVQSVEPVYCRPTFSSPSSSIYCKLNTNYSTSTGEYAEAGQPSPSTTSLIQSNDVSVTSSGADDYSGTTCSIAQEHVVQTSTSSASSSVRLTDHDLLQAELFYRSHETDVFVARCTADLLMTSINGQGQAQGQGQGQGSFDWNYVATGIPVLVLDSGEGRCRRRRLQVIVAERGTGFTLWRDVINCLTDYRSVSNCLHVMRTSNDHSRLAGLRFADTVTAIEFHQRVQTLTSNPDDSLLNLSAATGKNGGGKKMTRKKSTKPKRVPTKTDISAPCCFNHVTSLDVFDAASLMETGVVARPAAQQSVVTSAASDLPRL